MASSTNGSLDGDGDVRPRLSTRLSESFFGAAKMSSSVSPGPAPDEVLAPGQRRRAMGTLDDTEVKWSKAGLVLATILGALLTLYLSAAHGTRTETVTKHGHKVKEQVPLSQSWLLLGIVVLVLCAVGFVALRRRKRSLVAFSFFIIGFSFTLIFAPLGFALILLGGWLMLRAYRIQKYGTPNAKTIARQGAVRTTRAERKAAARTPTKAATAHKPTTANKRYTPKAAPRRKVPKPTE